MKNLTYETKIKQRDGTFKTLGEILLELQEVVKKTEDLIKEVKGD